MSVWSKIYSRVNWQNKPSRLTPLGKSKLNIMDKGIDDLDDRVIELHTDVENNTTSYVEFNNQNLAYNPDITLTMQSPDNTMAVFDTTGYTLNSSLYLKFKSSGVTTGLLSTTYKNGMASDSPVTISEGSNTITLASSDASDIANVKLTAVAGTFTEIMFCVNQNANYVPYYHSNRQLTDEIHDLGLSVEEDVSDLRENISEDTTVTTSTDSETYLYRQSKAIGDREYLEYIDGGSLGWNQLVQNGNFADTSGWEVPSYISSSITFSVNNNEGTMTATQNIGIGEFVLRNTSSQSIVNHKYFVHFKTYVPSSNATLKKLTGGLRKNVFNINNVADSWTESFAIINCGEASDIFTVYNQEAVTANDYFKIKNVNVIDLTLALGSTIADYVYSLEQATAGSGIAWLKEQGLFTDDYYPYDVGSIKSVNVSGHKMVGKNLFDGYFANQIAVLTIGDNYSDKSLNDLFGTNITKAPAGLKFTSFCVYLPKGTYTLTNVTPNVYVTLNRIAIAGELSRLLSGEHIREDGYTFTTTKDGYTWFSMERDDGYSSYNDINFTGEILQFQIEKGSTPTDYEPYEEHTYPITATDLRGIPQLTSDNKLGFSGDRYNANGRVDSKYDIVDLGSLSWNYEPISQVFYSTNDIGEKRTTGITCMCSVYKAISNVNSASFITEDKTICLINNTDAHRVYVKDSSYTDATTFKTALQNSNAQLVYEKATPTTENATPIINPQICSPYGTEEFISDSPVPVPHSTEYYKTPDWMDVEPFKSERGNNDSNTQLLSVINSRTRQDITDRLSNLPQAVAEQNLGKYGYKIGDYFVGASGYNYILADYNTFKGTSTPYCLTNNHIGIVVDTHATSQWYSVDASSVGYNGSTLHTYLKGTVMDNIKSDFIALFGGSTGLEHLLPHSKLLTTALANWGWQANQYISALSEVQIIGSVVWGANGYQTGEASKKLEVFNKYKWTELFESRYPWLRDLYTSMYACYLNSAGGASNTGVTDSYYVVGLINFY